jgi:carbamoyl-phosphate synthase large subunit
MKKNILVTGAGGPAAISFFNAIPQDEYNFLMGDIDPFAAGIYLVPRENRVILKRGGDIDFVEHLLEICLLKNIDVLVPTVDCELLPVAEAGERFAEIGVKILSESAETLEICLDKNKLMERCADAVFVPRSAILDAKFDDSDWQYPLFAKPRSGSGSRGIVKIEHEHELEKLPHNSSLLVQEFLGGAEYSVDVLANETGEIIAAVPRERMKVDSGIAVTSRTLHNERLEVYAKAVARTIGVKYVANIQFKLNTDGEPRLLEVNPRFPGTMPLTVECGVNMPYLSLKSLLGESLGSEEIVWRETAMVRTWQEHYLAYNEISAMENCADELAMTEEFNQSKIALQTAGF